jgi:uncharacterized protein DUF6644
MLWELAKWSEATALGVAIRNSQYAFPMIEYFHLAALAVIGGAILIVDMRMLGLGLRETPVAELAKDAHPWLVGSLIVMLVSGISLYTSEATKCYASPAFWIKMVALVLAILFTFTVRKKVALADAAHVSVATSRSVALVSVGLWFAVAWGGRWIGFGG